MLQGFRRIMKNPQPFLSDLDTINNLTEQLDKRLKMFINDYHNQVF